MATVAVTGARSLGPKIAICLATDALDVKRFRTLAKDLRAQTYRNWVCIVCEHRLARQASTSSANWPRTGPGSRSSPVTRRQAWVTLERALELGPGGRAVPRSSRTSTTTGPPPCSPTCSRTRLGIERRDP